MRRIFLPALLGLCAATSAAAQRVPAPTDPPRPPLEAGADTNDATAYFRNGVHVLARRPAEAAASFHWARRINPGMSDAVYGERTALMMSDRQRLLRFLRGDRRTERSPEMRQLDSLYDRAATADPFLQPRLDYLLISFANGVYSSEEANRRNPGQAAWLGSGEWRVPVPSCEAGGESSATAAWRAYSNGCFAKAVELYDEAIRRSRPSARLQVERARALFLAGRLDEALTGMRHGVSLWKKDDEDKDSVVFRYRSKAHLEESVGIIQEKMGDKAGARDSYGRALTEDISYFPAHVRLSALSLAAGDTAGAIGELDLAVQIQPNDAALRYNYGFALGTAKKFEEAAEQFRKATELEPWFAGPYYMLARIYDASGMEAEATQSYRAFVARAARRDPYLLIATQRLAELTAPPPSPAAATP
ncbi:MAG TPA: hypothetical protein VFE05_20535 [Longimicrobiaceae bacterium]|nr:hypothetical protein [Longimicrobiaceae bacterium]